MSLGRRMSVNACCNCLFHCFKSFAFAVHSFHDLSSFLKFDCFAFTLHPLMFCFPIHHPPLSVGTIAYTLHRLLLRCSLSHCYRYRSYFSCTLEYFASLPSIEFESFAFTLFILYCFTVLFTFIYDPNSICFLILVYSLHSAKSRISCRAASMRCIRTFMLLSIC